MKMALLVDFTGKTAEEAGRDITQLLTEAGYQVQITWPDLDAVIKRVVKLRNEIKKIK
jgi:hypothetical protein